MEQTHTRYNREGICCEMCKDSSRPFKGGHAFCGFDQYTLGALQSGDVYTDDSDVCGQLSLCTVVVSHSCGVSIACVTARPGTSTHCVCVCVCVCVRERERERETDMFEMKAA